MKLAVVAANWPHPEHSVRAANVVVFELTRALAQRGDCQIAFQKVGHEGDTAPSEAEHEGLMALQRVGVTVLPPIELAVLPRAGSRLSKMIAPQIEHFYPDVAHGPHIADAIAAWRPDTILVPWSEWLTAACSSVPATRFAYYGNPDHKTAQFRAEHDLSLGGSKLAYARLRLALARLERVHLSVVRRYHLLGDVAANDAAYYTATGHPNAFYVRNAWIDRFGDGWRQRRTALERSEPFVIVANVGKLDGTANRLGLDYLGRELLPVLRQRMRPGSYRIDIFGAGELHRDIAGRLRGPDVTYCGFVPDIDEAILTAPVFLCVNNATGFKVGHTRYLHAWTLGACVIAHRDAGLSMPEIVHGENALLGTSAEQIVDAIVAASTDPELRRRIGEGGWATYQAKFRAEQVAGEISKRIELWNRSTHGGREAG